MKPILLPALGLLALASTSHAQQPPAQAPEGSPVKMFIMQLDADKDGKISLEEFILPQQEQFKFMDKDGDGYITEAEFEAFAQEMRQRMQQQMQQQPKP